MVHTTFLIVLLCVGQIFGHASVENGFQVQDKAHLADHYRGELDFATMSDEELKFHYFHVHDTESNGKLDGCELVQALLHFHSDECYTMGMEERSLTDSELSTMVDGVLQTDDKNLDGFIDYTEYISGEISKGL